MKKALSLFLVLLFCVSLCACNSDSALDLPLSGGNKLADYPFVGTWANEEGTVYWRVEENGEIISKSILTTTYTSTVNGVTTSNTSTSVLENTYSWSVNGVNFLFNGIGVYTPDENNGTYCLIGEKTTYYRVGGLDYVIPVQEDTEESDKDILADSVAYTLGSTISAEGVELILEEAGVASNIRITSKTSGIQITSGPSEEAGKQYIYLKGTLKNTGKTSTRAAIAGTVYLDDYEFKLSTDTIATSGSPTYSIDPLETVHILLYAQVSDEMAGQFAAGKIIFGFNDNFDDVQLEQAQYLYYVNINR